MKTMKLIVVLGLATLKEQELASRGRMISSLIRGNRKFPEADFLNRVIRVETLANQMDEVVQMRPSASKADRMKGTRIALEMALNALASEVQLMINQVELCYEDRLLLVHEAGMQVRQNKGRTKRVFSVKHGRMKGSVFCYAARKDSVSHEWQIAANVRRLDERITLPTTTKSMTEVSGLTSGQEYAFYHRPVKPGTLSAWEGPIFLMVI
jgi:hypothetical protein